MAVLYALARWQGAFVKEYTHDALADFLAPDMMIQKPDGPGPHPVVIQFHGCAGLTRPDGGEQPILREYGDAAVANGVAAVTVDSLKPRGIARQSALAQICTGGRFRGSQRAGDVLAALDYVRKLDWVAPGRIALAGWSHGGWSIMDLLAMDLEDHRPHNLKTIPEQKLAGVAAVHLTYPWSGSIARTPRSGWTIAPPTRVVLAENDVVAPDKGNRRAIVKMREGGVPVEVVTIPGVTHGFDEEFQEPGSLLRFDPEAAASAKTAYGAWLGTTLAA